AGRLEIRARQDLPAGISVARSVLPRPLSSPPVKEMSYAAINDVTRGIRMLLHSQLVRVSSSAVVSLLPPGDTLPQVSGVNLYLYRVSESPFTKNRPWPGDRTTPPSDRPTLGLQLHYLLTPLATPPNDASFGEGDDAHTMLGLAMLTLQEHPVLNDAHLPALP